MAKDNFALGLGVVAGLGYLFTQIKDKTQTHDAEMVYRKYKGRKGPALSATSVKRGTRRRGNDGNMWEVRKSGKSQRWFKGAESFEGEDSEESKVLQQIKEIIHDPSDLNTHESFERIKYLMEEHGFATESFAAKEGNYKLGNYADYEILELDTHSYLMSVGHSESEAEDLIERYEAFIEVGFENGDSPYEIGISITENERLDNEAESFEAGEWGHGHGLSNIGIESCRKRLAIAEYVLSMSDAVQFYNDTLLQELGIDRYADDFEAESFEAEGCDHDWAITCIKCETRLRDLGDEI